MLPGAANTIVIMDVKYNIHYGTIHGFYWMMYATVCSFASVQLLACGFSNGQIGLMFAVSNILALILQPVFGDVADRSKRVTLSGLIEIVNVVMLGLFALLFFFHEKTAGLFVLYVAMVAFHTILRPLINALCFQMERRGARMNFGLCRCGGSLAYSVLCIFLGDLVEKYGILSLRISNVVIGVCLLMTLFLTARQMKKLAADKGGSDLGADKGQEITLADFARRHRMFLILSVGIFFVYIQNQVLNNFMLQIMNNIGGNSADMGRYFSIMAVMEIPAMVCFDWLNKRISTATLLKVSVAAFFLKIMTIWLAPTVNLMLWTNVLQTFSYGLFTPAIVRFIDERMSRGEAVKGQTLYTSMVTAAGITASVLGGFILDLLGASALTFISTVLTGIGLVIMFFSIGKIRKQ